ncbi:MAG TPA: DinB family protein [Actinomycetes bacterium]|nr:DinB family protein [Actinomycetes bacterium]
MNDREDLLARYADGVAQVRAALAGASAEDMDRAAAGEWSARQVVHHLADSETNSYLRLRRLIADEGTPQIQGYDEAGWAVRLHYADRPVDAALGVFSAVRAASLEILRSLADDIDWERAGLHSESGAYTIDDWLRIYADHAHDHADQIRRARQGLA